MTETIPDNLGGGQLVTYDIEGYGLTQPYYYPSEKVSAFEADRRMNRSRMPLEFVYKRASDFHWDEYTEDMSHQKSTVNSLVIRFKQWRSRGMGLYIFSKAKGSGKTMMACCVANELIHRFGISVKYVSAQEYIELMRSNIDSDRETIDSMKECNLLIIDDIGAESDKEWAKSVIFNLVDRRTSNFLPTIYTSNYELDKLKEDDRTVDRIMASTVQMAFPNISIRRKKANRSTAAFLNQVKTGKMGNDTEIFK